jgi:hypothetical protein
VADGVVGLVRRSTALQWLLRDMRGDVVIPQARARTPCGRKALICFPRSRAPSPGSPRPSPAPRSARPCHGPWVRRELIASPVHFWNFLTRKRPAIPSVGGDSAELSLVHQDVQNSPLASAERRTIDGGAAWEKCAFGSSRTPRCTGFGTQPRESRHRGRQQPDRAGCGFPRNTSLGISSIPCCS